jgi:predicted RNA binding protein YcfA (HicA-like mRNA interferase family)
MRVLTSFAAAALALLLAGCDKAGSDAGLVLAGMLDLQAPAGAHVVNDCQTIIAPGDASAPHFACVYFLDAAGGADGGAWLVSDKTAETYRKAMAKAGWVFARDKGVERYYERPQKGAECSDVAAMVSMQAGQLRRLITAASRDFDAQKWRGYGIPASLAQACGDDRINK